MKWLRASSVVALLSVTVLSLAAGQQAFDPDATLKQLNTWYGERVRQAQADKVTDFRPLAEERMKRAKEAVATAKISQCEPGKCYLLAQLFQAAGQTKDVVSALDRYLTSQPEPEQIYQAHTLLLSSYATLGDAAMVRKTLAEVRPSTPLQSAQFATQVAGRYATMVSKKFGMQAGLDALSAAEKLVPFETLLKTPDDKDLNGKARPNIARNSAEGAIYQLGLARNTLLEQGGKSAEALAAIEEARAKLPEGSRYIKSFDSKLTLARLPGSPAPELKFDRKYGDFTDLKSLKGKVVILDFTAHWCIFCKKGYPATTQMYRELKDKGLEIVGITTYYGYYEKERGIKPDDEYAKFADHIKEFNLPWPVIFGERTNFEAYGVSGIPEYVLIDRSGKVSAVSIGFSEDLHAKFRAKVEKLLLSTENSK